MADLRTRYLGLELQRPLVASASPLTGSLDGLRKLEAAGAGAVVLPSLFERSWPRIPVGTTPAPRPVSLTRPATALVRPPTCRCWSRPRRPCRSP
jgi:dihydroorotate dehydrogenase